MKLNPNKLDLEEEISESTNEDSTDWESEYYKHELQEILNVDENFIEKISNRIPDDEIKEVVNERKQQQSYRLGRRLNLNKKSLKALTESYDGKEKGEITSSWENSHTNHLRKQILENEALNISEETIQCLMKKYPNLTKKEIMEQLYKQQNYWINFHHRHQGVNADVIRKYLLIDEYSDGESIKVTIETPEIHDCNLVELTPELQKKAYWGYRGNRKIVSHLIDKKDCPIL